MNGRTLAGVALALALSGCSLLSSEDEAPPAATTPEPVGEVAPSDDDTARALPVGQPVPLPMAPPGTEAPPAEGAAEGSDGVYDIEE